MKISKSKLVKISIISTMLIGGASSIVGIILASLGGPGQPIPAMISNDDKTKLPAESQLIWDDYKKFLDSGIENTGFTTNSSETIKKAKVHLTSMGDKMKTLYDSNDEDLRKEFYSLRSTFKKIVDVEVDKGVSGNVVYKFEKVVSDNKSAFVTGITLASIGIVASVGNLIYYYSLKSKGQNPFGKEE